MSARPLTCAFGTRWPCGPCRKCRACVAEAVAHFEHDVFFGVYDARGFTVAERARASRQERTKSEERAVAIERTKSARASRHQRAHQRARASREAGQHHDW